MRAVMMVLLAAMVAQAAEAERYVVPKKDGVGVYASEVRKFYEEPLCKVGVESRLVVLGSGKHCLQVKTLDGVVGWIEKTLVVGTRVSRQMQFDSAEVPGWLDSPQFIAILEGDEPLERGLVLDRSFRDNIRDNTDRETVERSSR